MYPKIDFPAKSYTAYAADYCPLTLRYPTYAQVDKKETYFDEKPVHECWFDVNVPSLGATIHCSYYPIADRAAFEQLLNDAFFLAGKHNKKASFIDEQYFVNPHGHAGFLFHLTGPVASPYQFFITDSTDHFLRGALYFNTQARPDSLKPVVEFMKTDLDSLLQSVQFDGAEN